MPRGTGNSASSRRRRRNRGEVWLRVATAAVGIPIVLAVDYVGGWAFAIAVAMVAVVAAAEFYRMVRHAGHQTVAALGLPAAVALADLPLAVHQVQTAWVGVIVLVLALTGAYYLLPDAPDRRLLDWALSLTPVLYVGLLLGHLTLLRTVQHGARWVVLILVITWAYDIGAFFAGSSLGRRPFMQHISPRKTWEGVLGGLMLAMVVGLAGVPLIHLAAWEGVLLGLLGGVVAQAGDLVESMLKRQTGVKDSGTIVPGHGGLLDRIDSLLFTGVLAYYAALVLGYAS